MSESVRLERRFQGLSDGALGGYAAGVVASRIGKAAEANLRSLPPLERELAVNRTGENSYELVDGETLVLEARARDFPLDIPEPRGLEDADAASRDLVHDGVTHLYRQCFTCGPDRTPGDGLRLFMGRAPGRPGMLAAAWTPDLGLTDAPMLPPEFVWAALDCPTIWAAFLAEDGVTVVWPPGRFPVLARQRLQLLGPVPTGEPTIVTAWRVSRDGRKHVSGAAIHSPDGSLLVRAESLLIEVER